MPGVVPNRLRVHYVVLCSLSMLINIRALRYDGPGGSIPLTPFTVNVNPWDTTDKLYWLVGARTLIPNLVLTDTRGGFILERGPTRTLRDYNITHGGWITASPGTLQPFSPSMNEVIANRLLHVVQNHRWHPADYHIFARATITSETFRRCLIDMGPPRPPLSPFRPPVPFIGPINPSVPSVSGLPSVRPPVPVPVPFIPSGPSVSVTVSGFPLRPPVPVPFIPSGPSASGLSESSSRSMPYRPPLVTPSVRPQVSSRYDPMHVAPTETQTGPG